MITKKYYKLVKVSYEDEGYFYMENISGQTGDFIVTKTASTGPWSDVEYSLDGVNWTSYDLTTRPTIQVSSGSKIYIRGNNALCNQNNWYYSLSMNVDHNIGGNIYSLVDKNGFKTRTQSFASSEFIHTFENDVHLISAEKLNFGNVTTILTGCYNSLFKGCTSLTTAPATLPATTLTTGCYYGMFDGCASLTAAPELPATTLAVNCYQNMFNGCTSLNSVKCLATDISASNCTNNWLRNVSATGTFYKSANMNDWTTGNNGIPSGWTVVDA